MMKPSAFRPYALISCAVAAILAACGGSQPPIGAPSAPTPGHFNYLTRRFVAEVPGLAPARIESPSFKLSRGLLFVTNFVTNTDELGDVAVYNAHEKNPGPIAVITDGINGPGSACVDSTGVLYVPNQNGGDVAEYAPGKTKPFRYIRKGRGTAAACAIDSTGNLWLATLSDVIEYLKGSDKPHKFITDGITYANSVVFDRKGNMYVGNLMPYYSSNIQVYPPGGKSPTRTITDGVVWPLGTAVDASGTLYVANILNSKSGCGNIAEYRDGQSQPFQTITDDIAGPTGLALDGSGRLYEANGGINACTTDYNLILEFPLGSLKPSKRTITIFRSPGGAAYYPPQLP